MLLFQPWPCCSGAALLPGRSAWRRRCVPGWPWLGRRADREGLQRSRSCRRVAVVINSPGGSPVQSHLIFSRIRQLAAEKEKRVYVFCEDVAASGGYFLALAGDEIYADPSSIVGSIGVISAGFGLDKFIERFGIERRVHTVRQGQGRARSLPAGAPRGRARGLKDLQRDVHDVFIGIVKERRAGKLKGPEEEMFSGAFWSAAKALRVRPDRRHRRSAQQDARAARRQGAAEGRAAGARRPVVALPPSAGSCKRTCTTDLRFPRRWPMISSRPSRRGRYGRASASRLPAGGTTECPSSIVMALIGAGLYAGYRWMHTRSGRNHSRMHRAEDELQATRGQAAASRRTWAALEYDPATGVYRPQKRS